MFLQKNANNELKTIIIPILVSVKIDAVKVCSVLIVCRIFGAL